MKIANDQFDSYIKTETFLEMVKDRIEKSVQERWQNTIVVSRLSEDVKSPNDPSPFESGE